MAKFRALAEGSGLSLDELGKRVGYKATTARKSAWQFLNKTADPRLSMVKKFADALGIKLSDLLAD